MSDLLKTMMKKKGPSLDEVNQLSFQEKLKAEQNELKNPYDDAQGDSDYDEEDDPVGDLGAYHTQPMPVKVDHSIKFDSPTPSLPPKPGQQGKPAASS